MKAVCWNGKKDVRVETVPEPKILNPGDAILKVTSPRFAARMCTSTTDISRA